MHRVQRLDAVCEILMGQAPDGDAYNDEKDGWPLIAGAGDFGDLYPAPKKYTTEASKLSKAGDIILGIRATIGEKVLSDGEYCLGRGVAGLRAKANLDARYLWHWIEHIRPSLAAKGKGATFKQVNKQDIGELEIVLPPLPEQRRIAAILDQADALRAKRREALAQLDSLTQSIFMEMFGDPIDNPMSWPIKKLGEIVRVRRGGSPRPIEQFLGGTINWIKIGDATRGDDIYLSQCKEKITEAGLKKTVFLRSGSLIFANCGVSLGFARILKIDGCIHDGWLSFDEIDEEVLNKIFLLKALNSVTERFRAMAPSGTQPNLNTDIMKNFYMILPPIKLQKKFTERLEHIQALKATHETSLAELNSLLTALQDRSFRGEL